MRTVGTSQNIEAFYDNRALLCNCGPVIVAVRLVRSHRTYKTFNMKAEEKQTLLYLEYDLNISEGCSLIACVWMDAKRTVLDKRTQVSELTQHPQYGREVFVLLKCQLKRGQKVFPRFLPGEKVELKDWEFDDKLNYQSRSVIMSTKKIILGFTVRTTPERSRACSFCGVFLPEKVLCLLFIISNLRV